jgi:hypothetical protein
MAHAPKSVQIMHLFWHTRTTTKMLTVLHDLWRTSSRSQHWLHTIQSIVLKEEERVTEAKKTQRGEHEHNRVRENVEEASSTSTPNHQRPERKTSTSALRSAKQGLPVSLWKRPGPDQKAKGKASKLSKANSFMLHNIELKSKLQGGWNNPSIHITLGCGPRRWRNQQR